MLYQERLKTKNKAVNLEYDHRHIALQLRDHQLQYRPRKKSMSLLKPSVLSEINIKSENNGIDGEKSKNYNDKLDDAYNYEDCLDQKNTSYNTRKDELDDDSEFIQATENFSLKDAPINRTSSHERRANIANTLSKVKKSICSSVEITTKMLPSPKSTSSKSSSPSPVRTVLSPTPSPPLTLPLPQPGDYLTQETFLRILGLITPQQRHLLEKKRNERKKRSTTSTNKNEFVYGNFEMGQKKKKNNFSYLQQNVGPPQTRSQKMRRQQQAARHALSNNSPTVSPSASPPLSWPSSLRIPSGLTIQPVRSPGPKLCTVCGQNDSQSTLVNCGRCRTNFHSSCVSSPSSRSPSSRSRSPINGSTDRRYRRSEVICPECGDEVKEKTSNWTVIPRGFSNQNGNMDDRYKEKLLERRLLQEKNRQLITELRKLETRAEKLKENIEASNIEKKQLISNQNNTLKHIKSLRDFVSKFKDTSVSLHKVTDPSASVMDELSNGC
ncbi:uncharacterized protein LOC143912100 isoform X2 [Arctopsyche grandis]